MFASRSAQHRLNEALERLLAQHGADLVGRDVLAFEIGAGQLVLLVVLRQLIEQLLAPTLDCGTQLVGNRLRAEGLALIGGVEVQGVHLNQVDDADEGRGAVLDRAAADGEVDDNRIAGQPLADRLQGVLEIGTHHIHLVDEHEARHLVLVGLSPHRFRLRLNAFLGVEDDDAAVEYAQTAFDLGGEIDVAGRVDEVDGAVAPLERNAGAVDGDAAFLLLLVPVGGRVALVHGAEQVRGPAVVEEVFGGRGLARVDVGDDAQIADLAQV